VFFNSPKIMSEFRPTRSFADDCDDDELAFAEPVAPNCGSLVEHYSLEDGRILVLDCVDNATPSLQLFGDGGQSQYLTGAAAELLQQCVVNGTKAIVYTAMLPSQFDSVRKQHGVKPSPVGVSGGGGGAIKRTIPTNSSLYI
jgi:hypothetical protein